MTGSRVHNEAGMTRTSSARRLATAFIDQAPESARRGFVIGFVRLLDPRTEAEFGIATAVAEARWRIARLWEFEAALLNREIRRLKSLTPGDDPETLMALLFSSLMDRGPELDAICLLESRFFRQYERALHGLRDLRSGQPTVRVNVREPKSSRAARLPVHWRIVPRNSKKTACETN